MKRHVISDEATSGFSKFQTSDIESLFNRPQQVEGSKRFMNDIDSKR